LAAETEPAPAAPPAGKRKGGECARAPTPPAAVAEADSDSDTDSGAPSPPPDTWPPPTELSLALAPAMWQLRGRTLRVFISSVISCLFKPYVTVCPSSALWAATPAEPPPFTRTRRDLVHALVSLGCLDFLCNEHVRQPSLDVEYPSFPNVAFLKSVCNVAHAFLERGGAGTADLLRNCLALCARLLTVPEFQAAVAAVKPSFFIHAFFAGPTSLLEADRALASEAVSFVYIALAFQPALVSALARQNLANSLLFDLLATAHASFARDGFTYVHSLILAIALLLGADADVAAGLSAPRMATFAPFPLSGSFADLLIDVACEICAQEGLWPSLVCIFHMIAPHVASFTVATAFRLWGVIERAADGDRVVVPLFLEACAAIVQRNDNWANGFLVAIYQNAAFWGKEKRNARAVAVLTKWKRAAKRAIKASPKKSLEPEEVLAVLAEVEIEGELVEFEKHSHSYRGQVAGTWRDWIVILFVRACRDEVAMMQAFQIKQDPILAKHLSS
jgi:hypothetical protein